MRKFIKTGVAIIFLDSIVSMETRAGEPLTLYICLSSGDSYGRFFSSAIEKSLFVKGLLHEVGGVEFKTVCGV
jgi:hypothetical protein